MLAHPRRPMRVLTPVIEGAALTVLDPWQDLALGCAVALERIRDDDPQHVLQSLEQCAKKLLRRLLVAPTLHQDVEDVVLLLDSTPQVMPFTIDRQKHLSQVPLVTWLGSSVLQPIRIILPKLQTPLADGFMRDVDTAFKE
jgi:hypothetical protein